MTEEEISQAVRSLAQEIPSDKDGLWGWEVKWDYMDGSVIKDKLRPFVEKKIVEYLGVQEEMLVEAVEEHLRAHGTAAALVEELEGVCIPFLLSIRCITNRYRPSTTKQRILSRSSGVWSSSLRKARSEVSRRKRVARERVEPKNCITINSSFLIPLKEWRGERRLRAAGIKQFNIISLSEIHVCIVYREGWSIVWGIALLERTEVPRFPTLSLPFSSVGA
jgi:hypothetical protein